MTRLLRWKPGSSTSYEIQGLKSNGGSGIASLAFASDGSLWVGMYKSGPGLGLQQLQQGKLKPFVAQGLDSIGLGFAESREQGTGECGD